MKKILAYITLAFIIMQIMMVFGSWLLSAAMPDVNIRSLLSPEGIRWYFGRVVDNMSTTYLVDILLLSSGIGSVMSSGLWHNLRFRSREYRNRMAMRIIFGEIVACVCIMLLLTAVPHAMLLSVTGELFPSSFSRSIVPVVSFTLFTMSETYALVSSNRHLDVEKFFDDLTFGVRWAAPIILVYLIGIQLVRSVCFVFGF